MSDFRGYNRSTDPARNKAALYKTPGYDSSVASYNNWLYTPMDRRPNATTAPPTYTPAPGDYAGVTFKGATPPAYGGAPVSGSTTGLTPTVQSTVGLPDQPTASGDVATGTTTGLTPVVQSTNSTGVPTPPKNAMQRWQDSSSGIKPLSDARRYFWSTGSVDARAPMADPSQNRGAVAPVTFVNSPSDWQPY